MSYWIGQACGVIATIACIVIPVLQKKWHMLVMSIANNVFGALNLVFLGRVGSGIFMFIIACTQGVINLIRTLRGKEGKKGENIVFLLAYLFLGFYGLFTAPGYVPGINGHNLLELLPITGAVLNMCFISIRKEKTARLFFIACNCAWTLYYIFIGSSAILGTLFSLVSGMIALWRDRSKKAA